METGDVLPTVELPTGVGAVRWRDTNHSSLVVFPHDGCETCGRLVDDLADRVDALETWDARAIVLDGPSGAAPDTLVHAEDPDGRARAACDLAPHAAAVVVIDRFGQVFATWTAPDPHRDHGFPIPGELVEEARFLGIQCPECEVPDVPVPAELPG